MDTTTQTPGSPGPRTATADATPADVDAGARPATPGGPSSEQRPGTAGGIPDRIDDATAEAFRRDGVVHLEGAFTGWIDVLRAGVERNMRSPGPYTKEYEPEGSKGCFFGDYCNWARIPEYRDFVLHSPAARMAARLMDSSTARFFHEHVLVKEPGPNRAPPGITTCPTTASTARRR